MVDVETDGPCPGLFSMISLGAVLVEPRCGICGDRGTLGEESDASLTECACQLPSFEGAKLKSFYGKFRPLDGASFQPEALAVSGHSREETLSFPDPGAEMQRFAMWLEEIRTTEGDKKVQFISDNNGFDWQFVNYYFWKFTGGNPFGHSSTNLGSIYKGLVKDMFQNFKHLRRTKHTHHPVDDATGNAEAFVHLRAFHGLKVSWGVRR
jgi:hypothetical protein